MPNDQLFIDVLRKIEADPSSWEQHTWALQTDCGTAYCFAGHAAVLAGAHPRWLEFDSCPDDPEWAHGVTHHAQYVNVPDASQPVQEVSDYAIHVLGVTPGQALALFRPLNTLDDLYLHSAKILGLDVDVLRDKVLSS